MKQCWRWFGPDDPISLGDLPQAGVQGIVTALHHLPPGTAWSQDEIEKRQSLLKSAGYDWDVVESLPVSEAIKTQSSKAPDHIAAYKESLRALAAQGIEVICYNFMPVLDWTRTALRARQPHGGTAMAFDLIDFAAFDLHILGRQTAQDDTSAAVQEAAKDRFEGMSDDAKAALQHTIISGLPGANDSWTIEDVRHLLGTYDNINAAHLRQHLIDFLSEVAPLANDLGLRLCCHPDDPPFPLLGLPRILSSSNDYAQVLDAVDIPANGATLCTGSLGVAKDFDGPAFVRRHAARIHFAHLRNTTRTNSPDPARPHFFEAAHLEGDTDMIGTITALVAEEARRKAEGRADWEIPMRPDHGQELLGDLGGHSTPGYPMIGRLRGLAELRGVMAAVARSTG